MKKKTTGVNPRSSRQTGTRTSLGQLSKHYTFTLNDAQRSAWATFAATNPTINRLGNTTFLSGQQMFCRCNAQTLFSTGTIIATPPGSTAVATPSAISIDALSGGGGHIKVNVTATISSGSEQVLLYLSPPMNPGRAFISSQLRRMPITGAANTNFNWTTYYLQVFGLLPTAPGQRIFARASIVETTTGITSAFIQDSSLWT